MENTLPLASRGARLGAVLLDALIAFVAFLPGVLLLVISDGDFGRGIGTALMLVSWLAMVIVQIVLLVKRGQSIGKIAVGVKIVRDKDDTVPGFVKIYLLRSLIPALIGAIPYLGLIFALVDALFIFRDDRRCIHDLIAETRVVAVG